MPAPGSVIPFLRKKDYVLVKELGRGACGETVLLRDDLIASDFVCKKYSPHDDALRRELFINFIREIKLLHEVHHHNVVRVFNYYVYPDKLTGYILMEYVQGADLEDHLKSQPETINDVFLQTIAGFEYLERSRILHRDIRPGNVMVRHDGVVKIIDLGFGKKALVSEDFDKSISLNWWCEPPSEFSDSTYDHRTEVYFVGKLFEQLIQQFQLEQFKYGNVLDEMCRRDPADRISSFTEVQSGVDQKRSRDIDFSERELEIYREFANDLSKVLSRIESGAKYPAEPELVRLKLEGVYRSCMLEAYMTDSAPVIRAFTTGGFQYKKAGFRTSALRDFLGFLRGASVEKQRVAIANIQSRIQGTPHYERPDDDIPF